jgi:transposase InsO family protein
MHRAEGFMIEDDKLWRVSTKALDRVARTECQPTTAGFQLALDTHKHNGHFNADLIKPNLWDKYFWPGLNMDCRQACLECPHCKNFGPAVMNTLLQPVRCVKPFDLTAGDYTSLPPGIGSYKTLGVYIDMCSNFIWVTKVKGAGTAKTTLSSLQQICLDYATPRAFMTDGGSHFKNTTVDTFCDENQIQYIVTAAYAPWVNGLVESTNNLLLSRLKRLCSPNLDEEPGTVDPKSIPHNWPEHLDEAVRSLNDRIIPALNATPREIIFGMALHLDTDTTSPLARAGHRNRIWVRPYNVR